MMGDSEALGPSTSSPTKRPAEPEPGASDQDPIPKHVKKKANSTSVHEEFTRYNFTTEGGGKRVGSKCNSCGFNMRDINPTNLKLHLKRKHPEIFDKVVGGSSTLIIH